MGAGRGRQRRANQTADNAIYGKSLEEAGIVQLKEPRNQEEERIFQHACALGAAVLIDEKRGTWEAQARARPETGAPYLIVGTIADQLDELVAMHELGHIAGGHVFEHGDEDEIRYESEAWEWAIENHQYELSADANTAIGMCMLRRILVSKHIDGKPLPGAQDPSWDLVRRAEKLDIAALPDLKRKETKKWLSETGATRNGESMRELVWRLQVTG